MTLLRRLPILVMAMVMLGIVGVCIAETSVEVLLVAATLAALSWYITEGPRGRILPRWVANVLVIAVGLSVVAEVVLSPGDPAGALGRLVIWLTVIKLYQRRTARDHAQLMALSLLLVLVACLRTQELLFGVVLGIYAMVGLWTVLVYQLYAAHEAVTAEHRAAATMGPALGPAPAPTLGRRVELHFRLLAIGIGGAGMLLSGLLFLIFPRTVGRGLAPSYLGLPGGGAVTGYGDAIDLDAGTRISESRRLALDLRLTDEAGRPVRIDGPLLLRGAILDRYDNGRWTASTEPNDRIETTPPAVARLGDERELPEGTTLRQAFRFTRGTPTLFALATPVELETAGPARIAFGRVTRTMRAIDPEFVLDYTVTSRRRAGDVLEPAIGASAAVGPRLAFVEAVAPTEVTRVRELAGAILARAGVPLQPEAGDRSAWTRRAASALRDHLRSDAFRYTLDVSDVVRRDVDPTVSFLFDTRRGHCEFFASALAALCHAIGIDARVVAGYAASEFDTATGQYRVRDADAHAWVEVPAPPAGWIPMDPTPPAALTHAERGEPVLTDRLGWMYERLQGLWANGIIHFDDRSQSRMLETLARGWSDRMGDFVAWVREWTAQVNRAFRFGPAGYIWLGIVGLALAIAVFAAIRALRRYRRLHRALRLARVPGRESRQLARQLGFYPEMLGLLRRHGVPKPRWQPPLAFARTLRRSNPRAAKLVRRIAATYYEARYARRWLSGEQRAKAERLVVELDLVLRGVSS